MSRRFKDQREGMSRWTRRVAGLWLTVRFANLVFIALIAALAADFDLVIVILIAIVMFVVIVGHLTQWRRRRDA